MSVDFNAHIQSGLDPALVPGTAIYAQFWCGAPTIQPSFGTFSGSYGFTIQP